MDTANNANMDVKMEPEVSVILTVGNADKIYSSISQEEYDLETAVTSLLELDPNTESAANTKTESENNCLTLTELDPNTESTLINLEPNSEDYLVIVWSTDDEDVMDSPADTGHMCSICRKVFMKLPGLQKHMKLHENESLPSHNDDSANSAADETLSESKNQISSAKSAADERLCKSKKQVDSSESESKSAPNKRLQFCEFCGYSCRRPWDMLVHRRSHTGERPWECETCAKGFMTVSALSRHRRSHTGVKPYKCTEENCNAAFTQSDNLTRHMRIHSGETPYACGICNVAFQHSHLLSRHMLKHCPHKCTVCGAEFTSVTDLDDHINTEHDHIKHICSKCGREFISASVLKTHLKEHRNKPPSGSPGFNQCDQCTKHYTCRNQLVIHQRIHTGEKPYKCSHCSKAFRSNSEWTKHQRVHAPRSDRPARNLDYVCERCQKGFSNPATLKKHMKTHVAYKYVKCLVCQKTLTAGRLESHKRTQKHLQMLMKKGGILKLQI